MTLHQIFLLIIAALMFIARPVFGIYAAWRWLRTDPKDRPERQGGGGYLSNAVGGAMLRVDKLIRPSVEHQIEAETPILKNDE